MNKGNVCTGISNGILTILKQRVIPSLLNFIVLNFQVLEKFFEEQRSYRLSLLLDPRPRNCHPHGSDTFLLVIIEIKQEYI